MKEVSIDGPISAITSHKRSLAISNAAVFNVSGKTHVQVLSDNIHSRNVQNFHESILYKQNVLTTLYTI